MDTTKFLANDTIILQMDWILKAIYATVRLQDNRLVSTRGKLRATDKEDVWKDSYTSEERSLFMTIQLKSGLLENLLNTVHFEKLHILMSSLV